MVKDEGEGVTTEAQLEDALKSRLQYFRDNASSLTLGSIRRLLEEDLGLEQYALDVHKRFIKEFIDKNLVADEDIDSKTTVGGKVEVKSTVDKDKGLSGGSYKDEAKMEDSPIMGVLTTKTELNSSQGIEINESIIKKAIQEKADYFRSKSETLTLVGSRRYLEEELKLGKNALDPFKKFIRKEIEKVIESGVVPNSASVSKMGSSGNHQSNTGESTISEDSENAAEDQNEKPREKTIQKGMIEKLGSEKKHKRPKNNATDKKQTNLAKKQSEDSSDADNVSVSEDSEPQSSAGKPAKKKEVPTPTFGKRVEHLRSVIKACGMSIAPTVYKRAKQVPDSKREAFLIKELGGILSKEGLSKNPSEKEIKEVRKRKERVKELEGIDMSNIITSSRRRSSLSFFPPPRPKKKDEGEDDALSTKKDKNGGKDGKEKKEGDDVKDANKKEEDVDVKDAKGKGEGYDDGDKEEEGEGEGEGEDEDKDEEEEEDEDDSQNEFNDDDEDSS